MRHSHISKNLTFFQIRIPLFWLLSTYQGDKQMPDSQNSSVSGLAVSSLGPVKLNQRIGAIDVLRGFAVLGILWVNIEFFALPMMIFNDPSIAGGFTGINLLTWQTTAMMFIHKMMTIFSMLFGAGLILMYDRAESVGKKLGGVYYRRIFWLLVIGMLHAYLFWYGDILVNYAICGLLLFLFRKRSVKTLIIVGITFIASGLAIQIGTATMQGYLRTQADAAELARTEGRTVTPEQLRLEQAYQQSTAWANMSQESLDKEIAAYSEGSFSEIFDFRFNQTLMMQTMALFFMMFWRVMGLMLIGAALMKAGVFSGKRSRKFYISWAIVGAVVGYSLTGYGIHGLMENDFDFIYSGQIGNQFPAVGSVFIALAYVSVLLLVLRAGWLNWLTARLASVGRMALTNYLIQTLICTTIFYGYGLGLFGQVERIGLIGVVVAIWIVLLVVCPIWLKHFQFGPAEWLWRSLTYWRLYPFRVTKQE
jgi:uncharacterized protein